MLQNSIHRRREGGDPMISWKPTGGGFIIIFFESDAAASYPRGHLAEMREIS